VKRLLSLNLWLAIVWIILSAMWITSYWRSYGVVTYSATSDWSPREIWYTCNSGYWFINRVVHPRPQLPPELLRERYAGVNNHWIWEPSREHANRSGGRDITGMVHTDLRLPGLYLERWVRVPDAERYVPTSSVQMILGLWLPWLCLTIILLLRLLWYARKRRRGFDVQPQNASAPFSPAAVREA
jgi:hypothetical protein